MDARLVSLWLLTSISTFIIIPILILIMINFCQNKTRLGSKRLLFASGFAYFFITMLFCVNYSIRLLNECYLKYTEYNQILHLCSSIIYAIHFILLIYLLFARVYYIFKDTEYRLSLKTVYCFIIFCFFQFCAAASFMLIVYVLPSFADNAIFFAYLFGSVNMLIITIWITVLYIYKLFQVISHNAGKSSKNDILLQSITKYTVLAIIWISTAICFWIVPFLADLFHSSWYFVIYHAFILLDVSTNDIAFFLGFSFTDKLYLKCCTCFHVVIERIFIYLVAYAQKRRTKKFKNLYQRRMEERKRAYDEKKAAENKRKRSQSVAKIINSSKKIKDSSPQSRQRAQTFDERNVIQNIQKSKINVVNSKEQIMKEDAAQTPESPLVVHDFVGNIPRKARAHTLQLQMVTTGSVNAVST